ncbi:hypothetical protein ACFVXG_38515 [Kitasatospora sp. NPDC058162]|uniref:hypothetical protein n=1 Tax=Kitasatospora sp. NPDC058162 TaxID=3346362 RepID=UPI0036DA18CD
MLVYSTLTDAERLCSVGARAPIPVGEGLVLPDEVDLLVAQPDLTVRFRAAIAPDLTVTLTDPPVMLYDCLRVTYPPETFRLVLAQGLAALARRGIETIPSSKGPVCPVLPNDPLAVVIAEMIGPRDASGVNQLRAILRVREEAQAKKENAAQAVEKALHISESTFYRRLRQAKKLGLPESDRATLADTSDEESATVDPPGRPSMLWQ